MLTTNNGENKTSLKKRLLIIAVLFFILLGITASIALAFEKKYKNKIYPGVIVASIDMGGKTIDEANDILGKKIEKIEREGIKFNYSKHITFVTPVLSSLSGDSAYPIIEFEKAKTINSAFSIGRSGTLLNKYKRKINALFKKEKVDLQYKINEEEIKKVLYDNYGELEIPAKDAKLIFKKQNGNINFSIEKERLGKKIYIEKGLSKLKNNLSNLNTEEIILESHTDYPKIHKNECLNVEIMAVNIINRGPIELIATTSRNYYGRTIIDKKNWEIGKEKIAELLTIAQDDDKNIYVDIDLDILKNFIKNEISSKIEVEPEPQKFEMNNGRVTNFQKAKDGWKLDEIKNSEKIKNDFLYSTTSPIELIIEKIEAEKVKEDSNTYNIKEIIGTGHSSFSGSPSNRRHNIKTGANAINGLLIKPNDEFSLVKALGDVNAETGYLPELVIKGNKTIPEYGGGLCQIATTLFRTATESGLEITARRNHSYRVSYYEPAGTDAAVYDPWPDVRFKNDTGNYILIQVRFLGDDLYFDFWGKRDGRVVEKTDPVIYNITKPAPTKTVETLDLPVGEEKCTEHAHNGADAYFDYKVTYADGETKEERFSSHYVPWQKVCLIGVEKLSEEKNENGEEVIATSTPNSTN